MNSRRLVSKNELEASLAISTAIGGGNGAKHQLMLMCQRTTQA